MVPGFTEFEAADTVEVVAVGVPPLGVTVKVYAVPSVRPVTKQLTVPVGAGLLPTAHVPPAGLEVTVYSVATPSAANVTVTAPEPKTVAVGAAIAEDAVTEAVTAAAGSVPPVGVTVNVYVTPAVSPVATHVCAVVVPVLVKVQPAPVSVTPVEGETVTTNEPVTVAGVPSGT
jgi:hypothetical protein